MQLHERFAPRGLEVVYIGAIETEESCKAWKDEYGLQFPVISDGDGTLFRALTNGWVPWSILVGPDGKVVFSENEFDATGSANAIEQMYERPVAATSFAHPRSTESGCTVVLGGGTGGLVAARELCRRLPAGHHAAAVAIDRGNRTVCTGAGNLPCDALVISLGAELAPETVSSERCQSRTDRVRVGVSVQFGTARGLVKSTRLGESDRATPRRLRDASAELGVAPFMGGRLSKQEQVKRCSC